MIDLAVVGDVMLDVAVEAPALARGGDVRGQVRARPGGAGANAAVWGVAEGADVELYGRVGDDAAGRLVTDALRERGVRTRLAVDPDAATGAMLVVAEAGERSMVSDRGANARLWPADLPDRIWAGATLVSGYLLFDEGSRGAAVAAIERAAGHVAVDAASWPLVKELGAEAFFELTKGADILLANDDEAEALTGRRGLAAAQVLAGRYAIACVKLGREGAAVKFGNEVFVGSASRGPERVIDVTGAGDAFDAAFLVRLAGGRDPAAAARRAGLIGWRAATTEGPWPPATEGPWPAT